MQFEKSAREVAVELSSLSEESVPPVQVLIQPSTSSVSDNDRLDLRGLVVSSGFLLVLEGPVVVFLSTRARPR